MNRTVGSHIYQTCSKTQKKSTPLRKPKNKGGSPIGVSAPPMLLTRKIKNIIWYGFILSWLIFINGLIRSIEAPVVPITFAITAPNNKNTTLRSGVAFLSTFINIPPAGSSDTQAAGHGEQPCLHFLLFLLSLRQRDFLYFYDSFYNLSFFFCCGFCAEYPFGPFIF